MKKMLPLLIARNSINGTQQTSKSNKKATYFRLLIVLFAILSVSAKLQAQILLEEHFNNLTTVDYTVGIPTTNFDVAGWTVSSANKISVAEALSVCIGRSGNSGADLSTPALDLSGTDIKILSFKVKYYGTNGITGSTSSKVVVNFDAAIVFNGVKGIVSVPVGVPNYTATDWTSYSIVLTGGTATSKITFKGTSSNYAYMIDDVVVLKSPPPTVTTNAATGISFTNANIGGTITATAIPISASGVCWSLTNPNPTVADNVITTGPVVTNGNFSLPVTGLPVSSPVYYNTYITTPVGVIYGTATSFTTLTPVYQLVSSPASLDFGTVTMGTSSVLSYTVTGSNLTTGPGSITVTAPANFQLSTSATGPFTSTINIPYTGTAFAALTLYVQFSPTAYAPYSGVITLSGGGAGVINTINCTLTGRGKLVTPAVTSNKGNDFWLAFGYHEGMNKKSGDSKEAKLSVYVTSEVNTTVIVEMPGMATQTVAIPAGTVQEITGFPTGDPANNMNPTHLPDARLYYTGKSNRAIHVYSVDGALLSVWMYTYSSENSAAGSMIFPTNTWNTNYSVQAYGGATNSGIPNSFFYVIAEEDGTQIEFTPSVDILDSLPTTIFTGSPSNNIRYTAGVAYTITLNRGEVFNAMGNIISSRGLDLSGTTIRSTNCKKIAVFGGNGRVLVEVDIPQLTNTGSDNLVQQMFPKVAWGTRYYTVPTKHMEYNAFRINVDDVTTQVWVNDPLHTTPLTGLTNNYYTYNSNQPLVIESSKPVSVTQFIAAQGYATGKTSFGSPSAYGMNGIGDPEMIILSPAAQAIDKVTVFSPTFKNNKVPAAAYINVVIPKAGVNTFKLDIATDPLQMVDTGTSSYTGIPLDPAAALIPIANAFLRYPADTNYYYAKFKVAFPAAHSLESAVPFNAIAYGTNDGESYGFNAGTLVKNLTVPLIIQNPYGNPINSAIDGSLTTCLGTDFRISAVLPYETNSIKFSFRNNPNITPNTDTTLVGINGNIPYTSTYVSSGQTFYVYTLSTPYHFSALGDYPVDITSYYTLEDGSCSFGSFVTISYNIKVVDGVAANFNIAFNSCINDTVRLTDASNGLGYNITKWKWSYNNGTINLPVPLDTVKNPVLLNPANNAAGNYTLTAINSIGCFQKVTKALPVIPALPTITLGTMAGVCSNTAAFTLTTGSPATVSGVGTGVYSGPGVNSATGVFTPSVAGVGTHTIKYVYTNSYGCKDSSTNTIVVSQALTLAITPVSPLCSLSLVALQANNPGGTFAGPGVSGNNFDPAVAGVGTHTITYSIASNPCAISASTTITVNPQATANFAAQSSVCNTTPAFTLTGGTPVSVSGVGTGVYSGTGVNSSTGVFTPATAGVGTFTLTYTYTTQAGCVKSATQTIVVAQAATLAITAVAAQCINGEAINLSNNLSGGIYSGNGVSASGVFNPATAGIGTHTITYSIPSNACTIPASLQIVVNPAPTDVNAGNSLTMVLGSPVTLAASSTAGTYSWSPATGLSNPSIIRPVANPKETTIYTLTGTNSFGCSASDSMIVTVLIPCLDPAKVFTPNNDGYYDRWTVFNGGCVKVVIADVYNRWGSLVYHSGNYQNTWDGTYKNKPLPDGTYYYVIKATELNNSVRVVKGNVTIIR